VSVRNWSAVVVLVVAAGCPAKGPGEAAGFSPTEGIWSEGEYTFAQDDCGFADGDMGGGTFELDATDGGFVYADDTAEVACALDGKEFACAPFELSEDLAAYGLDAVLTFTSSVGGTFSTPDAARVDVELVGACDGADCASVAELDGCVTRAAYDATAGG
jgi:hypothetical protein